MKLGDIATLLAAEVLIGDDQALQMEIKIACGADLMSDVLAYTKENSLLLTGLSQSQVIRTAELMDLNAVVFVRGKKPDQKAIQLAKEKNIPLLMTNLPLFESCGLLFSKGVRGRLERGQSDG